MKLRKALKILKTAICFMLVLTMLVPTAAIQAQASSVPAEDAAEETLAQPDETEQQNEINLEYVYYNDELDDNGVRWIAASVHTDETQIDNAVLTYKDKNNQTSAVAADGYYNNIITFALNDASVDYDELYDITMQIKGEDYKADIQEMLEQKDVKEIELDAEEVEEIVADADTASAELEDIIAQDGEEVEEVLDSAVRTAASASTLRSANGDLVIVLDPGHGGKDSGAVAKHSGVTYYEKNLVLKIGNYLKQALDEYSGVQVYMTRSTDVFLEISDRVNYGKRVGADVLISLHLDSNTTGKVSGAHIIVSKGTYRPELASSSQTLANKILSELQGLGLNNKGLTYRMTENNSKYPNQQPSDYYGIIRQSTEAGFASMIIEHAFMNNASDITKLNSDAKLKAIAEADARGIVNYYGLQKGAWISANGKWYFKYTDGTYHKGWLLNRDKWYYMDSDGIMQTGWTQVGGKWYYMNSSGAMQKGWASVGGKWYYLNGSGAMVTGWASVGGKWYYMNSDGVMQTGWVTVGGKRYYLNGSGAMQKGWLKQSNGWYYLNGSGAMVTGWASVGGKWYYMNSDGVMQTGWVTVGGKRYYLNGSGAMQKGWLKSGNVWYYLNGSGAMVTGWAVVGSKWYYMNSDGIMQTGWATVGGKRYYLNGSGAMQKGWLKQSNGWYYLNGSGAMVTGWASVGGKWYYMNSDGVMLTGWQKVGSKWYYLNGSGAMQKGWLKSGSVWYYLNGSGAMVSDTSMTINGKVYNFNASGVCLNP